MRTFKLPFSETVTGVRRSSGSDIKWMEFAVDVTSLPTNLPYDPNPRPQNINRKFWRDIGAGLMNQHPDYLPNQFGNRNRGVTIWAENCKVSGNSASLDLTPGQGILDGGHTYRLLCRHQAEILEHNKNSPQEKITQWVLVTVLFNCTLDEATNIVEGYNSSFQVKAYTMANMRGKFDWIKDVLRDEPYAPYISYRENEKVPASSSLSVTEIIKLLDVYNRDHWDEKTSPIRAYDSAHTTMVYYYQHQETFESMSGVLKDLLLLRDIIDEELVVLYNASHNGTKSKRRFGGKAPFVSAFKAPKCNYHFSQRAGHYHIKKGVMFPMFAAFRFLLPRTKEEDYRWKGGFARAVALWRECAPGFYEMTRDHLKSGPDSKASIDVLGKDRAHWSALAMTAREKSHGITARNAKAKILAYENLWPHPQNQSQVA